VVEVQLTMPKEMKGGAEMEDLFVEQKEVQGQSILTWTKTGKSNSLLKVHFYCIRNWLKIDHVTFIPKIQKFPIFFVATMLKTI
jgi:hypothetical protein